MSQRTLGMQVGRGNEIPRLGEHGSFGWQMRNYHYSKGNDRKKQVPSSPNSKNN